MFLKKEKIILAKKFKGQFLSSSSPVSLQKITKNKMTHKHKIKTILIIFAMAMLFLGANRDVIAAEQFQYHLLESFPGFFNGGDVMTDFPGMILAIYKFGIWTVGIAGMFMLVIGGFMYMASAGNTATAGNAKNIIADSLLGIAAALGAYLIMYVINPDLTKIDFSRLLSVGVKEAAETSPEATGALPGGTAGSCGGLKTQAGIDSQCSSASPQLTKIISCIASKLPTATINSITDSRGYANCIPTTWTAACAHSKYSCHYGGKSCWASGQSYAVDLSTRNLNASQLIKVAKECGASYVKDESSSASHIHVSVGQVAGCGCN
jgi:hypothetical protein